MWRLVALLAGACVLALPGAAQAASGDAAATAAYVHADAALVQVGAAKLHHLESTLSGVLANVRAQCPHAAEGSPQDPESTLLSDELIGTMVLSVDHVLAAPLHKFVHATEHLHWHNGAANRAVHEYVEHLRAMIALPVPPLCNDVRTWAANVRDHHAPPLLPSFTRSFAPKFMNVWVAAGEQPHALLPLEHGGVRSLGARVAHLEEKIEEFEAHAVETYTLLMNALELWP